MKVKSYTDVEQSKKLAEILPHESADMHYSKDFDGSWFVDLAKYTSVKIPKYVGNIEEHLLPCWSLAALLNAVDFSTLNLHYNNARMDWVVSATIYDSTKHCIKYESTRALNLVDACVEMIIKLKERNLL